METKITMLPVDMLHPHRDNPRKELGYLTECLAAEGNLCPFYKTKEQANAELLECMERKAARMKKITGAVESETMTE